jgi:RNA polymerase sigma factor (sigma-70 family)
MEELSHLVRSAQAGDEHAYTALVERVQGMAVRTCYAMLGDWQLAEDAAQEAFLALHRELPTLRAPAAFTAWFRTVLRKHCDRLMRRAQLPTIPLSEDIIQVDEAGDPLATVADREARDTARVALQALPDHEHAIAVRFYVHEESQAAISAALGVSVQTIKNRLLSARRRMGRHLSDMPEPSQETCRVSAPGLSRGHEAIRERGMRLFGRYDAAPAHDPALLRQAVADLSAAVQTGDRRPETLRALYDALYAQGDLAGIVAVCGAYATVAPSTEATYWARERVAVACAQMGRMTAAVREHAALLGQLRRAAPPELLLQSFAIGEIALAWSAVGAVDLFDAQRVALTAAAPTSAPGDEARALALRTLADIVFARSGCWGHAASHAARLLELASAGGWPAAPAIQIDARGLLLAAARRHGDDERAADALDGALRDIARIDPATPRFVRRWAMHDLGMWCLRLGIYREARSLFERALLLGASPETALWLSAALLHDDGDHTLARSYFQRAVAHPRLSVRHLLAASFRTEALWAPVRHDPSFRAILRAGTAGTVPSANIR